MFPTDPIVAEAVDELRRRRGRAMQRVQQLDQALKLIEGLAAASSPSPIPAETRTDETWFVHVGAWLLPEAYGADYDHFTQTTMKTKPGTCIALYAKAEDLIDSPAAYRLSARSGPVPSIPLDAESETR